MIQNNFTINEIFLILPSSNEIIKNFDNDNPEVFKVEPRLMRVLVFLKEHQNEVVERETLIDSIWDNIYVGEDALTQTISRLRKIFSEDRQNPKVIETITKKGYRFVGNCTLYEIPKIKEKKIQKEPVVLLKLPDLKFKIAIPLIVIFILLYMIVFYKNTAQPQIDLSKSRVLTSDIGRENYPSISPSGNKVVFSKKGSSESKMNLYIRDLDTEFIVRFTEDFSDDLYAEWSPDGKLIAYFKLMNGSSFLCVKSINQTDPGISGTILLTKKALFDSNIGWSADNKYLIYSDREKQSNYNSVYIYSIDQKETYPLINSQEGHIKGAKYFDSGRIVYILESPQGDKIILYNILNKTSETLLNFKGSIRDIEKESNQSLIFVGQKNTFSSIYHFQIDDKKLHFIGGEKVSSISLNIKNHSIVYSTQNYNIDIAEVEINSDNESSKVDKMTLNNSTYTDWKPNYSVESDSYIFISDRTGISQIWLYNSDKKLSQLTNNDEGIINEIKWSPDNASIAYVYILDNQYKINLISPHGGLTTNLIESDFITDHISWSKDSKFIYYRSNRNGHFDIEKIDVTSRTTEKITDFGVDYYVESNENNVAYIVKSNAVPGIWKLVNNEPTTLESILHYPYPLNSTKWYLRKDGIIFKNPNINFPLVSIYFYDFKSKEMSPIYSFKSLIIDSFMDFDISKDRKKLIYSSLSYLESNLFYLNMDN